MCWPGFWSLFWVLAPSGPTSTTPPNPAAEASPSGITGLPSAWGGGGGGVALPCASLYMWGGSGNAPAAAWGAAGLAGTIAWVSSRSSFDLVRNCNCSGPSVGQTSGLPVGWASGPASRRQQGHGGRDSVNWQTSGPMPLGFQPMPFGYSLRGHCRTERRKDRWFANPKGIVSSSPGLPSPRGYPGLASGRFSTPTGLCPRSATRTHYRWGWPTPPAFPRVARGSQPWALSRNPFGIQRWNFRKAGAQILPALDYKSALRHRSCGQGH